MGWYARAKEFSSEVRSEVKKVSFPSRPEVISTTIVVLIASIVMAIYLWMADIVILRLYEAVLGVFS
jgi:preprotein translocase subunit SecE